MAGRGKLSAIRPSRRAPLRAAVLIGVHVLVALHVTHYLIAGKTLSPVEPSESMYALELGQLNAGAVFFAVTLLLTLVFGRFFCGWACHLVALQDLCGWLMKKVGIRPRPFRSRFLVYLPLALALYMFVFPTALRLWQGQAFPPVENHFMTDEFWKTFPGPLFATLTFLVCGFAAVYFLGAKGFCTYGCPYGGFFAPLDRLAPGRILVNDDCEQCGHCTAVCTSNVRVHEEVRRFGKVVDPGCMKCTDCVSVCPKNALRFGFDRPALFERSRQPAPRVRYDLGLGEELLLVVVALIACWTFRGLYDGPPLLMSVMLGGLTAFLGIRLLHLWRRPQVRLQNLTLKISGKLQRSGMVFGILASLWLVFFAHSAFAQWHRSWGRYHLDRTEVSKQEGLAGTFREERLSSRHQEAARRARYHFELTDRYGLFPVSEVKLGLAWSHLLESDLENALSEVRAAVALHPEAPHLHEELIDLLLARERWDEARRALDAKIAAVEATSEDYFRRGALYARAERLEESASDFRRGLEASPDSFPARFNLGGVLRRLGRYDEARVELEAARSMAPEDRDLAVELGLVYRELGLGADAVRLFREAIRANPDHPEAIEYLPRLIRELESP